MSVRVGRSLSMQAKLRTSSPTCRGRISWVVRHSVSTEGDAKALNCECGRRRLRWTLRTGRSRRAPTTTSDERIKDVARLGGFLIELATTNPGRS